MRSRRLRSLDRRIRELRNFYLPRNFSPTGNYLDSTYLNAAAFLLLSHAEIETFFEQVVFEKIAGFLVELNAGRIPTASLAILGALANRQTPAAPCQIAEIRADGYISRQLFSAAHAVRLQAESNNGIKSANVLPLLVFLGVDETLIDQDLLRKLDDLGNKRGQVGHHALHDLAVLPDPKESKELTYDIIRRLAGLENLIP